MGHQRVAQHPLGFVGGLGHRSGQAYAALFAGAGLFETALAAATGVDLRLDHPERPVELAGSGFGIFSFQHRAAIGHRRAVAP